MVEYSKVNVKLTDTKLKKLKRNLRMNLKMLDGNDLPHDLLLKRRQKAKLKNAYNNNMSTDLKLSKAQIYKIVVLLAANILASLGITAAASVVDAGI